MLGAVATILAGFLGFKWLTSQPEEKKDRSQLPETMLIKKAEAGEKRQSRAGLTEPVLRTELNPPAPDTLLGESEFLLKWRKARDAGQTGACGIRKSQSTRPR